MTTNWQDPAGTPPQPPTGGNNNQNKGKRFAIVAILLVVIAGLATTAGLVMVNRGDDASDAPQYVVMDIAETTPVFEPAQAVGASPFFHRDAQVQVFRAEVEAQIDEQVAIAERNAEPGEVVVRPEFDVAALDAAVETGLYGGTAENTCDPERLISFLYANPDMLEAWAGAQNIPTSAVADYIRSLDVRVLAEPLHVINHGYDETVGAAYEIDSVLGAGTAVLVDENGDVRTRCYCGNPIKPKTPEHMPPRCLVFGALVYVEPGGSNKREGVLRDVLLTGRQTTLGNGANWIEIKWGTADNQVGWTQANNLRHHYCPTPTSDRFCPGPGATEVWQGPDMSTHIGQVTGEVRTPDTTLDIFAPISPVGGIGNETVINDFMLIRFTEGAPSVQNSAWVKLADLNQDPTECERIRQCVDSDGPIMDRAGGGAVISPDGVQWVEFTGHFIGDPLVTFAEVRVNDGTGNYGWMSNFYTPLPDAECEPPVYDCIELGILFESSDLMNPFGQLANVEVTILDGPVDGNVQVQIDAPTGPIGWVGETVFYDGSGECPPIPECYNTTGPAWTEFATNGMMIGADATPRNISFNGAYVEEAGSGYLWINDGGTDYWIEQSDLQSLVPERCIPELVPECTMIERGPLDDLTPTLRDPGTIDALIASNEMASDEERLTYLPRCCVDALFNSTNVGDPAAESVPRWVFVTGSSEVAAVTWFESLGPRYFRDVDIVPASECETPTCPEATPTPGRDDVVDRLRDLGELTLRSGLTIDTTSIEDPRFEIGPDSPDDTGGECCVNQLFNGFQVGEIAMVGAKWVTVATGPHAVPAWYQTTDGEWFPETAVVDPSNCEADTNCPTERPTGPDDFGTGFPGGDIGKELFFDGLVDEGSSGGVILETAIDDLIGTPSTWCCVEGNVYDDIDGALKGTLDEPTLVILGESSDDGTWHHIIIDGPPDSGWVMTGQFLPIEDCRGDDPGCPEAGDPTTTLAIGRERCCAEILGNNGVVFDYVNLTGDTREGDLGTEYQTVDGEWITIVAFVPNDLCRPDGGCPETSIIDVQAFAAGDIEICCIAVGNGFEAAGLTGNSRFDEDGNVELERNTGEWIPIDAFVDASNCLPDAECPSVSVISPNDPSTCCVSIGGDQFEQVTLTGEQRDGDGGVEYEATNGEWYLFPDDFADTGRCITTPDPCNGTVIGGECCERPNQVFGGQCVPPCPTGQVRNANGVCVTPETPCPAGQVRDNAGRCITPGCENSDDDDICDVDDNCDFNTNQDQADADQDGVGDKCDPCTDADGDLFCEIPGDINNDNCWGEWNPEQSDVDFDGVGDLCDNCPNTANSDQLNTDGLGTGDACEQPDCPREVTGAPGDIDADGICNDDDNCPRTPNSDQRATDDDLFGDACDKCPGTINSTNLDSDGDGWGDDCDVCRDVQGDVPAIQIPNPDQGFIYDTNGDGINDSCYPTTSSVN